jgi:thioredoxin reductase/pSer/pThr/pTyr-binding forkhead associated (FHA) protein
LGDNKTPAGTYVNGARVTEVTLGSDDVIVAGSNRIQVREIPDGVHVAFRFVAEPQEGAAQVIEQSSILIGRKSGCPVQLNEPGISPVHAEIEARNGEVWITDKSTGSGLYVNGQRAISQRLQNGDLIAIKPFEIAVTLDDESCVLSIRQEAASLLLRYLGEAKPSSAISAAPDWKQAEAPIWVPTSDIKPNRFQYAVVLACLFAAGALGLYAWMRPSTTSPGPVSRAHASLECASCHRGSQQSASCESCHSGVHAAASPMAVAHTGRKVVCTACHAEHRGSDFNLVSSTGAGCLAAGCHVDVHLKVNRQLALSNAPNPSLPIPKGAAFEARFADFGRSPLHTKHVEYLFKDCEVCHTGGDPSVKVNRETMFARCVACHRAAIMTVAVPSAVALGVRFQNLALRPNDPLHAKHLTALSGQCASCHTDGDPAIKVPAQTMRLRCLTCHGYGPSESLEARCYSCHLQHDSPKNLAQIRFDSAPMAPKKNLAQASGAFVFLGGLLLLPIAYFAAAAGIWNFRQKQFLTEVAAGVSATPARLAPTPVAEAAPANVAPDENRTPGGNLRPLIDLDLCVGCGTCVTVCPFHVLEIVNEKAIASRLDDCTGFAACAAECPTEAIKLVDSGPMQTVELPVFDANFETNVPGLYLAGEATGKGLIKVAINQGKKVVESILRNPPEAGADFDLIVVGTGPAGTSAALAAMKAGLKVKVLEQGTMANTIRNYPRQKFVMAEPVAIPLYGPLWIEDSSKEMLLERWQEIVQATGLVVSEGETVSRVTRDAAGFLVQTNKGEYRGARVVLAIGRRGSPRKLGVPGEELSKVAYNLLDIDAYRDKKICVVGGGDTAIEAANGLARANLGNQVLLVHRQADFGRANPRNREKIAKRIAEGRVKPFFSAKVLEIREGWVRIESPAGIEEMENDFVFVLIGGESSRRFLESCGIEFAHRALG